MNKALRRDIYNLAHPGYPIDRVEQPDPDPLASIRYACLYWVDHLLMRPPDVYLDVAEAFQEAGSVDEFFRKSFLHWLESMSLLRALPDGVNSLLKFNTWTKVCTKTHLSN